MRKIGIFVLLLFCNLTIKSQKNVVHNLYVGTFTSQGAEGIYLCQFNTETGEITHKNTFKGIDNPSFLKISSNRKYLYAATRSPEKIEDSGGYISAYRILENGALNFINKQVSNGADPCHVDVSGDGKYVAIATYGGGTVSLFPVLADGKLQPASSIIRNEGSGPNKSRQDKPHAHSVKFSPYNNQVFSADLGTDQLNIFSLNSGRLIMENQQFVKLEPGAGPRHFDFHPEGNVIYVINELNSTVSVLNNGEGKPEIIQTISTLPVGYSEANYCADIHVSANGKYLYGSNRGHNSIVIFSIQPDSGALKFIGTISTQGDWPRNFTLSPDNNFMLVANQKSGNIVVFRINRKSGIPEYTGKQIKISAPVCLEFL